MPERKSCPNCDAQQLARHPSRVAGRYLNELAGMWPPNGSADLASYPPCGGRDYIIQRSLQLAHHVGQLCQVEVFGFQFVLGLVAYVLGCSHFALYPLHFRCRFGVSPVSKGSLLLA